MKKILFAISNILIGIFQLIYLLLQNRTIKINYFIINNKYTPSFDKFMNIYMWILSILILILLIITIIKYLKNKKANPNNQGYLILIISHIISEIFLGFMGLTTILSLLSIIGGIMLLKKDN